MLRDRRTNRPLSPNRSQSISASNSNSFEVITDYNHLSMQMPKDQCINEPIERIVHKQQSQPTQNGHSHFAKTNKLISHNSKHQKLHILLILLLVFCIFLLISLCNPNAIGIDDKFQKIYYPPTHTDNFIFVYGPMINQNFKLRKHIIYTPKSQRSNPFIHDHFEQNDKDSHMLKEQSSNYPNSKQTNDQNDKNEESEQYLVRIHHLKRGFYHDTFFDFDDGHRQMNKFANGTIDVKQEYDERINRSYTALGVQFDKKYENKINGLLLRIDEDALIEFDEQNKVFRREIVPLQFIDFLYTKPSEFVKNFQLTEETFNVIKDEEGFGNNESQSVKLKKKDIENANSMIEGRVDIEIENDQNENEQIELNDLLDKEQGVILEDEWKNKSKKMNENESKLDVMNEENTKKYQLNVWTYIVPKEIMIDDEKAQFARIMRQSYIDIVLSGCLEVGGNEFAKEFILSTSGWTPFLLWNDDRGHSELFEEEETFITEYEYQKIDALLKQYVFGQNK